jgi:hypothetical protein
LLGRSWAEQALAIPDEASQFSEPVINDATQEAVSQPGGRICGRKWGNRRKAMLS